ncbi:restriction endonuclease subunit S [Phytobacter diazotrophicus]|uniref:restriction endonuclease subunit S n=1 Tax=Phytobacter diazotrophicus TaxID=395631 RepID=UPI00293548D2|nr:restriction endonuclease subunit S [Phytobacter diazotrophicus]MDV2902947.1 restriction endonuclease subunit S [Phytobacter diazotrophicus]
MVKLSQVCSVLSGFAFKSNYFGDSGIPLVRIRDVMRGFSETYYSGEYDEQFVVNDNDILIGMDGDFNIAKWAGGEALLNQRVCKIAPVSSIVDADYLYYFLPLKLKEIWDETAFVTVKHLSVKKINDIEIPLPKPSIQKEISAMLRVSDSLRNQLKKMESELNALAQAVYESNVGISAKEHSNWSSYTISDLCDTSKSSMRTGPFGSDLKHSEFVSSGVAVIGIDNAVSNEFRWAERRFITKQKYEKLKRYTVHPHDVIITIMGTTGRVAVIPADIPLAISTKHLAVLTLDKNKANPHFIADTLKWNAHVIEQIKRSVVVNKNWPPL